MTSDELHELCARICRVTASDVVEVAAALGLPGDVVEDSRDIALLVPPTPGARRVVLGRYEGAFTDLGIVLSSRALTLADLDRRFGPGERLPRRDPDRPYKIAYRVELAGAPFSCALYAVIADVTELPHARTVVTELNLRRDARD